MDNGCEQGDANHGIKTQASQYGIQGADLKVVKSFYVFSFLFPVVLVTSLCERIFKFQMKRESWIRKLEPPPKWVNSILVMLGSWEIRMGKFIRLPFGTTYVVIAEK